MQNPSFKQKLFTFLILTFAWTSSAQAQNMVRVWEGVKQSAVPDAVLLRFLNQLLIPATISANPNSIEAYIPVVLRLDKALPKDAYLQELPFHEAALVIHQSQAAYDQSRADNPWYGPVHFLKLGGFDEARSFSATPVAFESSIELVSRENRIAYNLSKTPLIQTDWQAGETMSSVILRRQGPSDEEYARAIAGYASEVREALAPLANGHFLRAGRGHVLEFVHFPTYQSYVFGVRRIADVAAKYDRFFITDYFQTLAQKVALKDVAIEANQAVNVSFLRSRERPQEQCEVGLTD